MYIAFLCVMKKYHVVFIAVSILAGLMLNAGCKLTDRYNVQGTWTFTGEYAGIYFEKTLIFTGGRTQGTVRDELSGTATYTFDGYTVNFDLSIICFCQKIWVGYFVDKDHMEGNLSGCSSGTWTASRI